MSSSKPNQPPPEEGREHTDEGSALLAMAAASAAPMRQPSPGLRDRVLREAARIRYAFVLSGQGIWLPAPNAAVATKELFRDSGDRAATRLLRIAAGHELPPPPLSGTRSLYVIEGQLRQGDLTLGVGDFVEESGSMARWQALAPTVALEASDARELASGLYASVAATATWHAIAPGIRLRQLVTSPETHRSLTLIDALPGATLDAHDHAGIEELFVLRGSCDIEDHPMQVGDYHRAVSGSDHRPARTGAEGCQLLCSVRDPAALAA